MEIFIKTGPASDWFLRGMDIVAQEQEKNNLIDLNGSDCLGVRTEWMNWMESGWRRHLVKQLLPSLLPLFRGNITSSLSMMLPDPVPGTRRHPPPAARAALAVPCRD
jgi:hypothetical protein